MSMSDSSRVLPLPDVRHVRHLRNLEDRDLRLDELLADIAGQVYVAFGQGTGQLRLSSEAIRAVREYFLPRAHSEVFRQWQEWQDQALSRVRAIGRMAAGHARNRESELLEAEDFLYAARSFLPDETDEAEEFADS